MVLLLSCIIALMSMLIVLAIGGFFSPERETVEKRLARYAGQGEKISLYQAKMEEPFLERVLRPAFLTLTRRIAALTPEQRKKQVADKIYQAGYPFKLTVETFIMVQVLLVSVFPLLMTFLFFGAGLSKAVLMGVIALFIGIILPEYYLRVRGRERTREIQENLPDLIDLLTVSVEAGLGFDAALSRVIDRMPGQLAIEFKRLLQEIRMGKPRLEAFRELGKRSTSSDLNTFCSAITQADQLGVSIGKVLRIQSDQMRQKRRQRAEESAMKAPIKMIFPLVLLIFPALFIILLGPAVIRLISTFGGN